MRHHAIKADRWFASRAIAALVGFEAVLRVLQRRQRATKDPMRQPSYIPSRALTDETLAYCATELERRHAMLSHLGDGSSSDRVRRIELALSWLRSGNYGSCAVCRTPLPEVALRADPERMICRACAVHSPARGGGGHGSHAEF